MKIIITGAYAIGTHLARLLSRNHEDITLIDPDPDRLARIGSDYDLLTMVADPDSIQALTDAGVGHTDLFIAVTPDQSLNLNCCILAKALGAHKTVARIDRAEYIEDDKRELFARLGVDELIYPEVLAARDINNGLKMSGCAQWSPHPAGHQAARGMRDTQPSAPRALRCAGPLPRGGGEAWPRYHHPWR